MNRAAEESARVPWLQKRDAHARVLAGLGEFVARVDAELAAHRELTRLVEDGGWRP